MNIFYIITHSIEPYNLNSLQFSKYDAYPHLYCKIAKEYGHNSILAYLSLSDRKKTFLNHKYGYHMISYPVTFNKGYFGYEVSKQLLEDVIRCEADIIHVHSYYLLMYDLIGLAKKINKKHLIAHYHGGDPNMLLPPLKVLKKMTLHMADKVITVNKTELQILLNYWRMPVEKVIYIPNSVDTNLFKPLTNIEKDDNTILFVGNLVSGKGIELLISSFIKCKKIIKNLQLLIVGTGYMQNELINKVTILGLSKDIKFLGRLNHELLSIIYNKATVTILPSEKEAFGLVITESMACGTPVIATVNDGSRDQITSGVEGLLVPQGDEIALSNAICTLISDKITRKKMSLNARKKSINCFSWEKIGVQINDLYKSL